MDKRKTQQMTYNQENNNQETKVSLIKPPISGDFTGIGCLIVIYGENLGKKIELPQEVITIGRDQSNFIILNSDSVSRKHAQIEYAYNCYEVTDLNSKNGTYLNDSPVSHAKLKNGDLIKIGNIVFKFLFASDIEASYHEEIYRMTIYDGLTQIYNKRYAIEFLEREVSRARRHQRPLSILMMDIDHFKNINDTHGHLVGDHLLKELAKIIDNRIRREELFARFGGEEFLVVLPESDRNGSVRFAETLRNLVGKHQFKFENTIIPLTISIGIGSFSPSKHSSASELVEEADKNLYIAKNKGRNCFFG